MLSRLEKFKSFAWFLLELAVYACFVAAYFFLVLHFLGGWLKQVFDDNKTYYAFVALALIVVQGALLEMLTSAIFSVIRGKTR